VAPRVKDGDKKTVPYVEQADRIPNSDVFLYWHGSFIAARPISFRRHVYAFNGSSVGVKYPDRLIVVQG